MAEACVLCTKPLGEKYRLQDKFRNPTQLGRLIEELLDEQLCEVAPGTVCSKCRSNLLHLDKLKREYDGTSCVYMHVVTTVILDTRGQEVRAINIIASNRGSEI